MYLLSTTYGQKLGEMHRSSRRFRHNGEPHHDDTRSKFQRFLFHSPTTQAMSKRKKVEFTGRMFSFPLAC